MSNFNTAGSLNLKDLKVVIPDIKHSSAMKPAITTAANRAKKNITGIGWDDDNVKYKINTNFSKDKILKSALSKPSEPIDNSDDILYKFPVNSSIPNLPSKKVKSKNKIKVKFWSLKVNKVPPNKDTTTTPPNSERKTRTNSPKSASPRLRHKVSFLPPPSFKDYHAPMVTVPDDLTVHFTEEEANDLLITTDSVQNMHSRTSVLKRSPRKSSPHGSPKNGSKRKRDEEGQNSDLEYFAKYVVQKLRKMETNQRIYSENLINTVLMLGQLDQLNGKSRVSET